MPSSAIGSASRIGGMGYASEAVRALILHAFETRRLRLSQVGHFTDNPASARIIAKFGFMPQGKAGAGLRGARGQGALPDLPAGPRHGARRLPAGVRPPPSRARSVLERSQC